MIVNGFLHVAGLYSEKWIKLADVRLFETPGSEGKPTGWPDDYAAGATLATGEYVSLTTPEWEEVKRALGFPETAALGAPKDWPPEVREKFHRRTARALV